MARQDEITPEALRRMIRRAGLTREEAAEAVGVSRRTLQRWLSGHPVRPAWALFVRRVLSPKRRRARP